MFEPVSFYNLKIGNQYFITGAEIDIIYYKGIFEGYAYNSTKFYSLDLIYPFCHNYCEYRSFHYYPIRYYYQFISKKKEIQQAMETRALNKILKQIIGDEYFEWF